MLIESIELSDHVADKIEFKHGVKISEVWEIFFGDMPPQIVRSERGRGTYVAFGQTDAGRYLAVFFVPQSGVARVLSARDMDDSERRRYHR